MPAVVRSQVETHGSRLSGKSCGRALDRECGRVLPMPPPGSGRDVRLMERDGRPVAILVHDSALSEDGKVMDVVAAAAGLTVNSASVDVRFRS